MYMGHFTGFDAHRSLETGRILLVENLDRRSHKTPWLIGSGYDFREDDGKDNLYYVDRCDFLCITSYIDCCQLLDN